MKKRVGKISLSFGLYMILFAVASVFMMTGASSVAYAKKVATGQKTFVSPEEAVGSLVEAIKKNDVKRFTAIFGKGSREMLSSGDKVADRFTLKRFIEAYEEKSLIEPETSARAILHVGKDEWPFPIPIVKKGNRWVFDTKAGKEELDNRRVGRNELNAIDVLIEYADVQLEYAEKDRDGDGVKEYAQKVFSEKGKKDGLYWDAAQGEEESPMGPFVADATKEGYTKKKGEAAPTPYRGYYFKILKAQGPNAVGGAYSYIVNNNMVLGFAMIAWPAKYGSSGIMTFIVNQSGVIYQKDLGKDTDKIAQTIKAYDPDKTWKKVEEKNDRGPESGKK
jgi:hypothetical protein